MVKKTAEAREILSLEEVNERYLGEWVLLRVTQLDEEGEIIRAQVLKHSRSRAAISPALARAHDEDPNSILSVFLGGTRKVTWDEWRAILRRLAEEEYVNARW